MTPWRAEPNGQYWMIGFDLVPRAQVDTRSEQDDSWHEIGNYFQHRTQTVKAAKWVRAGLSYIHGDTSMDAAIERLIEARKAMQI